MTCQPQRRLDYAGCHHNGPDHLLGRHLLPIFEGSSSVIFPPDKMPEYSRLKQVSVTEPLSFSHISDSSEKGLEWTESPDSCRLK